MIIRNIQRTLGINRDTLRAFRDVGSFLLVTLIAIGAWHPVVTPLLLGVLYGGNELGFIHGVGHNLHQWGGKDWRRTTPRSLQVYRAKHMSHHIIEAGLGKWFDKDALSVRKRYRATPAGVWVFIIGGHFGQLVVLSPLMLLCVTIGTLHRDSVSTAELLWSTGWYSLLAWLGVLSFYATYEVIHWCTHRPDITAAWRFRSRLHALHHDDPKTNFGITSALNVGEHLPRWVVMWIVGSISFFERLLSAAFPNIGTAMQEMVDSAEAEKEHAIMVRDSIKRSRAAEAAPAGETS